MGRSGRWCCVKTAVAVELCAPRLTCLLLLTVVGPPVVPSCWHSETTAPKQAHNVRVQLQRFMNMFMEHESGAGRQAAALLVLPALHPQDVQPHP